MDRLNELALLVAILDGGSLAAGARKTQRSPTSATRTLADLETRLGTRLIERTTRRIVPTEAGRRLAEHARRLLSDFDDAIHDVTGESTTLLGTLRVTAPLMFGRLHVAPIVRASSPCILTWRSSWF
jgi:DNA-binding transcriptional LysR family regulator